MLFKKSLIVILVVICTLAIIACASTPPVVEDNSAARSRAAAENNFAEMEGRRPNTNVQPIVTAQPVTTSNTERTQQRMVAAEKPLWINNPEMDYDRQRFVFGVGNGASRDVAEKNAIANLISYFGVSVQADQTVRETYLETIKSQNITDWTQDHSMQSNVKTMSSMDALFGAEIREVWYDESSKLHYAIAVLEKTVAAKIYKDTIIANQDMIKNLITMSPAEKNSLSGYSRYGFAAVIADMNVSYGNLLNLINSEPPNELVRGDVYRLEMQDIAKAISIEIKVNKDKSNRIQSAFAKAISEAGFRTGGNNAQYLFDVDITISEVVLPNNQNKFVRIELSANLKDKNNNSTLLTWNFNDRQGHTNIPEAENRAYSASEKKITAEFKDIFSKFISELIPQK